MSHSSKLLEGVIEAFAGLPGIGRKSAMRLALHLLERPVEDVNGFATAIQDFRTNVKKCVQCGYLADGDTCNICNDTRRHSSVVCVVESIRDVLAIERTEQFYGLYHVLGGIISPIDGIAPQDLNIEGLFRRIPELEIKEVILAVRPSIEGDTTSYYLSKKLEDLDVKISVISRGISFGGELEYADEITLGRSISGRLPYNPNSMLSS
jgi:recombination protein RecR